MLYLNDTVTDNMENMLGEDSTIREDLDISAIAPIRGPEDEPAKPPVPGQGNDWDGQSGSRHVGTITALPQRQATLGSRI